MPLGWRITDAGGQREAAIWCGAVHGETRQLGPALATPASGHALIDIDIGADADAEPGKREVLVRTASGAQQTIDFVVAGREFPEEQLTIANRRHVNPEPADLERCARVQDPVGGLYPPATIAIDLPTDRPTKGMPPARRAAALRTG